MWHDKYEVLWELKDVEKEIDIDHVQVLTITGFDIMLLEISVGIEEWTLLRDAFLIKIESIES